MLTVYHIADQAFDLQHRLEFALRDISSAVKSTASSGWQGELLPKVVFE
jgi:hypothetical protein